MLLLNLTVWMTSISFLFFYVSNTELILIFNIQLTVNCKGHIRSKHNALNQKWKCETLTRCVTHHLMSEEVVEKKKKKKKKNLGAEWIGKVTIKKIQFLEAAEAGIPVFWPAQSWKERTFESDSPQFSAQRRFNFWLHCGGVVTRKEGVQRLM